MALAGWPSPSGPIGCLSGPVGDRPFCRPGQELATRAALRTCATVDPVAGLRWLFIFLLWAALDLSGPLLLVPAEVFEESEEAAHRSGSRRREQPQADARKPSARVSGAHLSTAQLSRVVTAVRGPRPDKAGPPPKLPLSESVPDSASDDH